MKPGVFFCLFTPLRSGSLSQIKTLADVFFFALDWRQEASSSIHVANTCHSNSGGNSDTAGSASASTIIQQVIQIRDKCFVCPSPLGRPKQEKPFIDLTCLSQREGEGKDAGSGFIVVV